MKRRTKIFLIILIILLIIGNYGIYIVRIRDEVWEIKDLIFFLGILNSGIILVPTMIYLTIVEEIEKKEQEILLSKIFARHEEEVNSLKNEIDFYTKYIIANAKKKNKKSHSVKI